MFEFHAFVIGTTLCVLHILSLLPRLLLRFCPHDFSMCFFAVIGWQHLHVLFLCVLTLRQFLVFTSCDLFSEVIDKSFFKGLIFGRCVAELESLIDNNNVCCYG